MNNSSAQVLINALGYTQVMIFTSAVKMNMSTSIVFRVQVLMAKACSQKASSEMIGFDKDS